MYPFPLDAETVMTNLVASNNTNLLSFSLSKPREIGKDREVWCAAVHGVTRSCTWLNDWTTLFGGRKSEPGFTWLMSGSWQSCLTSGSSREEVILLHVPAHIRHLHSWAHGPSFFVKTKSVSSSNLSDLGFYVNISHLWLWLSWLHFIVTLAILQIIQGNLFISKSVIKSHLQSLFFYVK